MIFKISPHLKYITTVSDELRRYIDLSFLFDVLALVKTDVLQSILKIVNCVIECNGKHKKYHVVFGTCILNACCKVIFVCVEGHKRSFIDLSTAAADIDDDDDDDDDTSCGGVCVAVLNV